MMKSALLSILLFLLLSPAAAQGKLEITIRNNSFELDRPSGASGSIPFGWRNPWTYRKLNTPTMMSPKTTQFGVRHQSKDGQNFVALVSREDYNHEGISQVLEKKLVPGKTYLLHLLASSSSEFVLPGHSIEVKGKIKTFPGNMYYNNPVRLVVLAQTQYEEVTLGKTGEITFDEWREYTIEFTVPREYKELVLTLEPVQDLHQQLRNGNVLIDRISHIYRLER